MEMKFVGKWQNSRGKITKPMKIFYWNLKLPICKENSELQKKKHTTCSKPKINYEENGIQKYINYMVLW